MGNKGSKTRYVGLLLIFVMFFSKFAFGVINSFAPADSGPSPTPVNQVSIERHTKRLLSEQEKTGLLKNGVTIIEFFHTKDCTKCKDYSPILESFSTKYANILLEDAEAGKDAISILGKSRKELQDPITENSLLEAFCEVSFVQPKDCILKQF